MGHIVAVSFASLRSMCWCQVFSGLRIEDETREQAWRSSMGSPARGLTVFCQPGLHLIPQFLVDDGRVIARIDLSLVCDPAKVDRVGQDAVEMPSTEALATCGALR